MKVIKMKKIKNEISLALILISLLNSTLKAILPESQLLHDQILHHQPPQYNKLKEDSKTNHLKQLAENDQWIKKATIHLRESNKIQGKMLQLSLHYTTEKDFSKWDKTQKEINHNNLFSQQFLDITKKLLKTNKKDEREAIIDKLETLHGIITEDQAAWIKRIEKSIKKIKN